MFKIEKITDFLHSFTTPILLVVLGVIGACFGFLFIEVLLMGAPIITLIVIIVYAYYLAKKSKY